MFEYQGAAIPWLFEVSSDGQYIAVLQEAALEVFCVYFSNMGKLILIAIQGVEFSGTIQYTDWTKTCGKRSGPTVEKVSLDKRQKLIMRTVVLLALTNIGFSGYIFLTQVAMDRRQLLACCCLVLWCH